MDKKENIDIKYFARARSLVYKLVLFLKILEISQIAEYQACLNAFLTVIPNIVTKFQSFDIFEHF